MGKLTEKERRGPNAPYDVQGSARVRNPLHEVALRIAVRARAKRTENNGRCPEISRDKQGIETGN